MKFFTKKFLAWVIFLLAAVMFAIFLAGCGDSRGSLPPDAAGKGGVSTVLHRVALVASAVAGSSLILAGIAAIFLRLPAAIIWRIVSYSLVTIAIAQAVYWIASHIWVLMAALAAVLAGWVWLHRRLLERFVGKDLDGDGKLGDSSTRKLPAGR